MGKYLSQALMSIGEDVQQFSQHQQALGLQADIARLRDQRDRDLAEVRAQVQLMIAEMRGGGSGSRGGGPAAPSDLESSVYGIEARQRHPSDFRRDANVVRFDDDGNAMPPAMVDDPQAFAAYNRQQQRALEDLQAGRQPQARDDYARGRIAERAFEAGFSDVRGGTDTERARQAVRAAQGKDRYTVHGDEKIDDAAGFMGQTEQGGAKARAAAELSDLRERTDPNRPRGAAPADGEIRAANTQVETARRALKDAQGGAAALLKQSVRDLNMSADERARWIASQPAVQDRQRSLAEAEDRLRQLLRSRVRGDNDQFAAGFADARDNRDSDARPSAPKLTHEQVIERARQAADAKAEFDKGYGQTRAGNAQGRQEILDQAREAIRRGASRQAVADRLRQFGVDPSEL